MSLSYLVFYISRNVSLVGVNRYAHIKSYNHEVPINNI